MKLLRTFLNEEQYKNFQQIAKALGLSEYGLTKKGMLLLLDLPMNFLRYYGKEMHEDIDLKQAIKDFFEWYGKELAKDLSLTRKEN